MRNLRTSTAEQCSCDVAVDPAPRLRGRCRAAGPGLPATASRAARRRARRATRSTVARPERDIPRIAVTQCMRMTERRDASLEVARRVRQRNDRSPRMPGASRGPARGPLPSTSRSLAGANATRSAPPEGKPYAGPFDLGDKWGSWAEGCRIRPRLEGNVLEWKSDTHVVVDGVGFAPRVGPLRRARSARASRNGRRPWWFSSPVG